MQNVCNFVTKTILEKSGNAYLSFGMVESETGSSSTLLLKRLRISMFSRLAMAEGISVILLCASVSLVTLFRCHRRGISSRCSCEKRVCGSAKT